MAKSDRRAMYVLCALYTVVLLSLTYILQTYQLTYREEADIFLYDSDYLASALSHPGGGAMVMAGLCSQFFIWSWAGPLIVSVLYGIIIVCLVSTGRDRGRVSLPLTALSALPCLCLMLCFENMSFRTYGLMAVVLCVVAIWLYDRISAMSWPLRLVIGTMLCVGMYWIAGSASLMLSVSLVVLDICHRRRQWVLSIIYPAVTALTAYMSYKSGGVHTLSLAFTPDMYYEMGSTYFMMLYALCAVPLYLLIALLCAAINIKTDVKGQIIISVVLLSAETALALNLYSAVHSRANYETMRQRYYARQGQWDAIMDMPYTGEQTPYTSYRFLALAERGQLADRVREYRPFISYLIENKPKVKRLDQQVYSDIYYACDYMAAARRAAFDTDIVTPGSFNPYETLKLAEINIAYGDYAVADKLLGMLDKTLFYSSRARELRALLYDDAAVEADAVLGQKRRAIPPHNDYMSPKGIQRDLRYIIDTNADQTVAREFYRTFRILTNQNEDI